MSSPAPVSFTIRRPTPISRESSEASEPELPSFKKPALPRHLLSPSTPGSPLARSSNSTPYQTGDSSDSEDDEVQDELVTGFDQFGVQRAHEKKSKKPDGPLVIPALKNRDWREFAKQRRGQSYVPDSARAGVVGADGSVGGLGTRDSINSGPQLSGLQVKQSTTTITQEDKADVNMVDSAPSTPTSEPTKLEETEDERARRLLLAGEDNDSAPTIIPILPRTVSETDAYKQDVEELPDSATLDDYNRVPVHQFGAALLRGMGWKEGEAASKRLGKDGKKKGIVEPYLPEARPALLGIGAKEKEVYDDGSKKKYKGPPRPERRYVPVVKRDSQPSSRRTSRSRSPPRKRERDDSRGDSEYRSSRRYRDDDYDSGRDKKSRDRDRDYGSSRDKREYDDRKRRDYDSGRNKDRRRDYSPDRRDSRDYR